MKVIYADDRDMPDRSVNAARRRVSAVMSSPVRCIPGSTSLGDALQIMMRAGVRHLAVIDDLGDFLGTLSDRTIAAAWAVDPSCLTWTQSAMVLEPGPATVSQGAHVLEAARVMRSTGTDAVVVLDDDGVPIGIVTGSDMIAQLAR